MGVHLQAPKALMERKVEASYKPRPALPVPPSLRTDSKVSENSKYTRQLPDGYVGTLIRAGWQDTLIPVC